MSAVAVEKRKWTVEEFLDMERDSLEKHEFYDGEVFAMEGVGPEHDQIVANLIAGLVSAFGDKCRVFTPDLRLFAEALNKYTYSDGGLVCGPADFTADRPPALRNPHVIIEVLSESTERYDRTKKFQHYQAIPSFADYVLVSQDQILVEHFRRQQDGWLYTSLAEGVVHLPCGDLPIAPLYRGVLPAPRE